MSIPARTSSASTSASAWPGQLIDDDALAALLAEALDSADGMEISFFEATTAAAFLAFSRTPADACIVEVGLGGRLDATNVLPAPAACGNRPARSRPSAIPRRAGSRASRRRKRGSPRAECRSSPSSIPTGWRSGSARRRPRRARPGCRAAGPGTPRSTATSSTIATRRAAWSFLCRASTAPTRR
jgi:hypothetical protein